MAGTNNSLGRLTSAEHRLFVGTAMSVINGMFACADKPNWRPLVYPEKCAGIAFDIAEEMVKEYRKRLEPNER